MSVTGELFMDCPECDRKFEIEDYTDQEPFDCPYCGISLRLDADEGTFEGAVKYTLVILD